VSPTPRYVEYGGRVNAPPPFLGHEGSFRFLLLQGDAGLLKGMCERMLTGPAAGAVEYRAIGSHVLLLMGAANFSSLVPAFKQMGFIRETQLSLWLPVQAGHMNGSRFVADRLCLAVPYIFVDNPMSYIAGREDYGYPKSMGIFEPPDATGDHVTLKAFGGDDAPTNQVSWKPVLEVARGGGQGVASAAAASTSASASIEWRTVEELTGAELPCGVSFIADLVKAVLSGQVRQVFLKQFRDCDDPTGACYQAIVEAPMKLEDVSWALSLDAWTVTVHPLQSHPITAELGVKDQTAQLVVDLKMNMTEDVGVVVAP
jgi:hypothetical protein